MSSGGREVSSGGREVAGGALPKQDVLAPLIHFKRRRHITPTQILYILSGDGSESGVLGGVTL